VYPNHLFFQIVSISSINIIDGAVAFALAKSSLTLAAHIHTNSSINSDQEAAKKGTPASHATALAKRVFQLPGGQ
jgi:hypothetical protein